MVAGVSLGKEAAHRSSSEVDFLLIGNNDDPVLVNWHQFTVHLDIPFFTVNGLRTLDEFLRINHVRRTTRMQYDMGVWQMLHELAGAAGMVEMYVGEKHVVDVGRINILVPQRRQQIVNAVVDTGVDECGVSVLDNEVTGIE